MTRDKGVPMYEVTLIDSQAWGDSDDKESSGSIWINPLLIVSMKEVHQKYISDEHKHKNDWLQYPSPTSGPFMYTEIYLNDGRSIRTLKRIEDIDRYLRYC
jgi:hypothetical protein